MNCNDLLKKMISIGASDLHLKAGRPPLFRVNGIIKELSGVSKLTSADTMGFAKQILSPLMYERFSKKFEIDSSYSLVELGRFRVNAFRQRGSVSIVLRAISNTVPTLDTLGLPPIVKSLIDAPRGLILVTGITGSGKSSTLAAMIDEINENAPKHIVSIEDPVEFLHRDKRGLINQREIGIDTETFDSAFVASLRQDPDVIMVGELRDAKTMETALRAAETGHLVMSTLHTSDAKETINRIIDLFPVDQHRQVRLQLSSNLNAVISQRLLRKADNTGRVLACEIMIATAAIRDIILDPDRLSDIRTHMEKGRDQYGSQTFDQAILDLLNRGIIDEREAMLNATSPNDLKLKMTMTDGSSIAEWM